MCSRRRWRCWCGARCAQVCTSVFRCAQFVHVCRFRLCTVCTVCRMSLSPDGGFQRVFCEVCAHLQNVSDSVAELDAPRESSLTDSDESVRVIRKKQLRKGFQPGEQKRALAPDPGAFPPGGKVATFPGAPGAVRGRIWPDLAKSGAPAAILINAYSGDFCHPVLSNALAQEPLVYHSGTRELFSDIFGNTSKTDGTESDILTFLRDFREFVDFDEKLQISCEKCVKKTKFHMFRTCLAKIFSCANSQKSNNMCRTQIHKFVQMCKSVNAQICKCAKNRRAQNAQICSANYFPNAEITNLHCAQKHKCKFLHMSNFVECKYFFRCVQTFFTRTYFFSQLILNL